GRIRFFAHQHELLPTKPPDGVSLTFAALENGAEAFDDDVTNVVPVSVVYLLEVIDVSDDDAQGLRKALGRTDLVARHLRQRSLVQQARHSVRRGQLFQALQHSRIGQRYRDVTGQDLEQGSDIITKSSRVLAA